MNERGIYKYTVRTCLSGWFLAPVNTMSNHLLVHVLLKLCHRVTVRFLLGDLVYGILRLLTHYCQQTRRMTYNVNIYLK